MTYKIERRKSKEISTRKLPPPIPLLLENLCVEIPAPGFESFESRVHIFNSFYLHSIGPLLTNALIYCRCLF